MNAIFDAYENVRKQLQSGVWQQGERLPSLAELAKQCSVSRTTMWRALARLQKESLVHVRRRGSIIAGITGLIRKKPSLQGFAWERLKERMGQEILSGEKIERSLPPINKMAMQYGVAITTLKKALEQLTREGLLVREGRRYHQAQGRAYRRQRSIVLISAGNREGGISLQHSRIEQIVDSFERECQKLGFASRCEGFNHADSGALLDMSSVLKSMSATAGYVVAIGSMWNETHRQRWVDLIHFLTGRDVPVVVIDQDGDLLFPEEVLRRKNLRVLRIAGVRAGELVAQALLHTGHRQVAFLMHYPEMGWANARYTGLSRYYQQYGEPGTNVELYTLSDKINDYDLALAMLDLDKTQLEKLFSKRFSHEEVQGFLSRIQNEKWTNLKKTIPSTRAKRTIHTITGYLLKLVEQEHEPWIVNQELERLLHLATIAAREWYLDRLFADVSKNSPATAWVCPNDQIAVSALLYLRKAGKKVPDEISVIGFENWIEARENLISTFDFNMQGILQEALLMIVDEKTLKDRPLIAEIDGYVVVRRTTRK